MYVSVFICAFVFDLQYISVYVNVCPCILWPVRVKIQMRVAHGSPLAWLFALSEDIYIWNEQLRKMGLISPLRPQARPSCGCRVNLSQMRWLEPDPLSQIPSPCTLEPHEISKLKPPVIGISPTLHKSSSNVMLWNVRRAMQRNMCWWTGGMTCRWNKVEAEILLASLQCWSLKLVWSGMLLLIPRSLSVFFIFMRRRTTSVCVVDLYWNSPGTF